ncbi:MAG: hypothetical protein QNJ94_18670 [Alphaproteobacteria bacterium]|nr:hypothetical protein [Alphaproteobacteria bacterium]
MARIRTIKPEFWASEQVIDVSRDARLLFIGLWTYVDDNGVIPVKPRTLKMQVFPADDDITSSTIRLLLDELSASGLIAFYTVDGVDYLHVTGWKKHQKIDRPSYKYPPPPKATRRALVEAHPPEGSRREGSLSPPRTTSSSESRSIDDDSSKARRKSQVDADFEEFWNWYPRKVGKAPALQAYRTARRTTSQQTLCEAVARYRAQVAGKEPQFILHPKTWLNQRRWEDEEAGSNGEDRTPLSPEERQALDRKWLTIYDRDGLDAIPEGLHRHVQHLVDQREQRP